MFESLLDVLFPIAFLMIPVMGVLWLSTKVFGVADTKAAIGACCYAVLVAGREVGLFVRSTVTNFSRALSRGVVAFAGYDPRNIGREVGTLKMCDAGEILQHIARLDDRIDQLKEHLADIEEAQVQRDVEASTPF